MHSGVKHFNYSSWLSTFTSDVPCPADQQGWQVPGQHAKAGAGDELEAWVEMWNVCSNPRVALPPGGAYAATAVAASPAAAANKVTAAAANKVTAVASTAAAVAAAAVSNVSRSSSLKCQLQ
jgi:hypothetical protein